MSPQIIRSVCSYIFIIIIYLITITVLDIIYCLIIYLERDNSENGFHLRLLMEPTQFGGIDR
jgi:hypothetical protein